MLEGFQGTDVFALGHYMQRDLNMLTDSRCHPPSTTYLTAPPRNDAYPVPFVCRWCSAKTRHRALARLLAVITAPPETVRARPSARSTW